MEWDKLVSAERIGGELKQSYKDQRYKRSEFEKDYRRIVSSASFRRLQDKTQVFPLDNSDFVRTRLTHSVEVASFAKELGEMVVKYLREEKQVTDDIEGIPDILLCAGLLHDIGNPPFGHFGENIIGDWYKKHLGDFEFCGESLQDIFSAYTVEYRDLCNFEGNAQAFRVLTKLHFVDNDCGLNLTSAVLNSIIKYPCTSLEKDSNSSDVKYHKMGYFYGDREYFRKTLQNTGTLREDKMYRHPLAFLLEAADDIAYATADLEDGFKKGLFNLDRFIEFLNEGLKKYEEKMNSWQKRYTKELFDELSNLRTKKLPDIHKEMADRDLFAMQNWIIYVQGWLTYCAYVGFTLHYDEIMNGVYPNEILADTNHEFSLKILKDAMKEFIYPYPRILKLELAADSILSALLERFVQAVIYYDYHCPKELDEKEKELRKPSQKDKKLISLLSNNYIQNYKQEVRDIQDENQRLYYRLLLVNDFISGMTDSYAKSLYQELMGIY